MVRRPPGRIALLCDSYIASVFGWVYLSYAALLASAKIALAPHVRTIRAKDYSSRV